jgi:hypothetical protein
MTVRQGLRISKRHADREAIRITEMRAFAFHRAAYRRVGNMCA